MPSTSSDTSGGLDDFFLWEGGVPVGDLQPRMSGRTAAEVLTHPGPGSAAEVLINPGRNNLRAQPQGKPAAAAGVTKPEKKEKASSPSEESGSSASPEGESESPSSSEPISYGRIPMISKERWDNMPRAIRKRILEELDAQRRTGKLEEKIQLQKKQETLEEMRRKRREEKRRIAEAHRAKKGPVNDEADLLRKHVESAMLERNMSFNPDQWEKMSHEQKKKLARRLLTSKDDPSRYARPGKMNRGYSSSYERARERAAAYEEDRARDRYGHSTVDMRNQLDNLSETRNELASR